MAMAMYFGTILITIPAYPGHQTMLRSWWIYSIVPYPIQFPYIYSMQGEDIGTIIITIMIHYYHTMYPTTYSMMAIIMMELAYISMANHLPAPASIWPFV